MTQNPSSALLAAMDTLQAKINTLVIPEHYWRGEHYTFNLQTVKQCGNRRMRLCPFWHDPGLISSRAKSICCVFCSHGSQALCVCLASVRGPSQSGTFVCLLNLCVCVFGRGGRRARRMDFAETLSRRGLFFARFRLPTAVSAERGGLV